MPRTTEVFTRKLNEYLTRMRNKGLTERYVHEMDMTIRRCMKILKEHDRLVPPAQITQEHLAIIRESIPFGKDGKQESKKRHVELFRMFLGECSNRQDPLLWPEHVPDRPRISMEDFQKIIEGCLDCGDIRGATVMQIMSLSARRVAVLRARPEDISPHSMKLRDKGRGGGKERNMPIEPEEYENFLQYLHWRQLEIQKVLKANPNAKIPDRLIIWTRKNAMGNINKTSLDTLVKKCGRRVGIHLTSHMLRRMAARELYDACKETGAPIDTAMEITGHKNREIFMDYVGAIDDQKRDLRHKVLEKRNRLFHQNRGNTGMSQA